MPFIRSSVSEYYACLVTLILSLSVIIPLYSYYAEKGLVYIIIVALFSYQPSSCSEYIKLNIYSSCNIRLISNTKYIFLIYFYNL